MKSFIVSITIKRIWCGSFKANDFQEIEDAIERNGVDNFIEENGFKEQYDLEFYEVGADE